MGDGPRSESTRQQHSPVPGDMLAAGIHETRRPLTLARGYLQMLSDESLGSLTNQQRRAVERIEEKLQEAQGQLDVLARLGIVRTKLDVVDVDEVVRRAIRRAEAEADLRQGRIELLGRRHARVLADVTLLDRILDNLLDNALTYSSGPPRIVAEVGVAATPFVRVRDAGFGMPPDIAPHVFSKGFRGDRSDPDRPGSGLGLYLSREAAQHMGGSLELEWSEPGVGTSFRLELASPPEP